MYNTVVHIILTHEQADFDALASLLGAHLLDERATPVLPRRMNRNVRAFITLYGLDLPFIDPRDLPKDKLESVTLVDTQSLVTLKGMTKETQVNVIDHHPPRPDLPPEWHLTTEDTGAATTILVEGIQQRDIHLTLPQATLLLLGIYEDTGGLTYTRTTARDMRAAAFLLEQGATLQVAGEFLNHPLSHQQQEIYDQLRQDMRSLSIHGYNIMLASGDASGADEELSTIAHKLRDVLDPDALILLIATGGGVQLIARSTTDQINVGELAAAYGGGGHPRAAAALIHEDDPEALCANLEKTLPRYVRPAVTVAEIMSRGPQLVPPDMPVAKVAELMQRYGYEGFPVVEEKRVVGLVTRRAVDRAMGHKLNLMVRDVMQAGEAGIKPDESIESLQKLMTDTGWGQIPVLAQKSGEVIGIVTRTDLIKTLTPEAKSNGRRNLAVRLETNLPPGRLALLKAVAMAGEQGHHAVYVVGGFVRDLLLERPSLDYDLVVEGDAIALGKQLVKTYGGRVTTHARFGTAKWRIQKIAAKLAQILSQEFGQEIDPANLPPFLDLVTARREFYTEPTVLPTVERGSIKLDLHRRDFTINTLALRLDGRHYGQLLDYWGGLDDLGNGMVRVLHSLSFVDDPTRILRAVRFEQRFGYHIEDRTLELLVKALPLLDRVSGDRLRHELNTILLEDNALDMLTRLHQLNALKSIHPQLDCNKAYTTRIKLAFNNTPSASWELAEEYEGYPLQLALAYVLWLMPLERLDAASVAGRLKLPGWLTKYVLAACLPAGELAKLVENSPSQIVALLDEMPPLALYAHSLTTEDKPVRQALADYISTWRHIQPHTSGHDLREKDIPPGPIYRQILDKLRAAWLDGQVSNEKEELKLLEELLHG